MTIMDMFNEQLKKLPDERERLMEQLKQISKWNANWNETKAMQAFKIVYLEKFELKSDYFRSNYYSYVSMKPTEIFFSFEECSIKNIEDFEALHKYVQSLLDDLNQLSNIIQFSISGQNEFNPKDGGRMFRIDCTF